MLLKTYGATMFGVDTTIITIEVVVTQGAKLHLVGLPDNAVRESNIRIETALKSVGLKIPGKKIVINMAPADIKKEGSAYDVAIAMGILGASEQIKKDELSNFLIMGELSLDGSLLPIKGALPIAIEARKEGFKGFILPEENANEAAIVDDLAIYGVKNIRDIIDFFNGNKTLTKTTLPTREAFVEAQKQKRKDFSEVKGQDNIKRALEIAAAGGHNVL